MAVDWKSMIEIGTASDTAGARTFPNWKVAEAIIEARTEALTAAQAEIEAKDAALRLAEDALRNHACEGPGAPCLRSLEQCRADCGRMASQALEAVLATLAGEQP